MTKAGGFSRAAERLDMAVQTISVQVRELEKSLGHQLLKPAGRGVALTEAGRAAFMRADEVFQLGQLLVDEVQEAASGKSLRLTVGFADDISKLAAHALLQPIFATPALRLICHDGETQQLLSELAIHELDVVFVGQAVAPNPNLRLMSERLVQSHVQWCGPDALVRDANLAQFPHCLSELPVLLPSRHSPMRPMLDRWFELHDLRPRIVGEFEDSALMAVFAARGMGVFPLSRLGADGDGLLRGLRVLGCSDDLKDEIHIVRSHRGQHNPLVLQIVRQATVDRPPPVMHA